MKCTIMQPTYIPWSGFFNLIFNADVFVFLDDVQFEHQSWQTRNKVLNHGQEILLPVPVMKHHLDILIYDVKITRDPKWRKKHIKTIQHAYRNAPYYSDFYPEYEEIIMDTSIEFLSNLNITLIKMFTKKLNLESNFLLASELNCSGDRSEHVLQICERVGADEYISPLGAKSYIEEDEVLLNSKINVIYQNYKVQPYEQPGSKLFTSHLSIVDVAMRLGCDLTKNYLVDGWNVK